MILSAAALYMAIAVDRFDGVVHYVTKREGSVAYSGVFSTWIDVPYRVPMAIIAVAVFALAVVLLTQAVPHLRRWVLGLLSIGSLILILWPGGLTAAYLDVLP